MEKRSPAALVRVIVVTLALSLVVVFAVHETDAAFVGTTANSANSLGAGTVSLLDDDVGSALLNLTGLIPSLNVARCITVTYNGSVTPADVKLYASVAGTGLGAYLNTTIEVGSGGAFGDCTGFTPTSTLFSGTLSNFASTHSAWANGLAAFTADANPTARTFRFTVSVADDNLAQGLLATVDFTWEAR